MRLNLNVNKFTKLRDHSSADRLLCCNALARPDDSYQARCSRVGWRQSNGNSWWKPPVGDGRANDRNWVRSSRCRHLSQTSDFDHQELLPNRTDAA
jgi:hypothetical protein